MEDEGVVAAARAAGAAGEAAVVGACHGEVARLGQAGHEDLVRPAQRQRQAAVVVTPTEISAVEQGGVPAGCRVELGHEGIPVAGPAGLVGIAGGEVGGVGVARHVGFSVAV